MRIVLFIIASIIMTTTLKASSHLKTHQNLPSESISLSTREQQLKQKENPALPIEQESELLKQLSEFELGRFLLINKGLNGYWTSYIITDAPKKTNLHPLERWIIESAPSVKATRERFQIFQKLTQQNLKDNISIASIPCGVMNDLYLLNYTGLKNVSLTGIDLDGDSVTMAEENAPKNKDMKTYFHIKDAWNLSIDNHYDIITSNGLNIYEPNDQKVIKLYKEFYKSLKPNGILITSFLTPPPALSKESTWKNVKQEDAIKQKALFSDIIGVNWQSFRTEKQTESQLQQAGFTNIKFIYDSQGIFPTVVAQK